MLSAHQAVAGQLDSVEAAEEGDGDAVSNEETFGHSLNLLGSYGFNAGDDFFGCEELVEVHLLPGKVGHAGVGAFKSHQDVALELVLAASQFFFAERILFEVVELGHDEVYDFKSLACGGAGVDAEGAGVAVRAEVGVDGVSQAALFADGLEETGAHAAAKDGIEDKRGEAVIVGDGGSGNTEAELNLLEGFLVLEENARAGLGSLRFERGLAG